MLYPTVKKFKVGNLIFNFPLIKKQFPVFTIVPSFKCNLSCSYCQYKGLVKNHPDMSLSAFSEVLEWLSTQNIKYIRFMGGELIAHPLINDYLSLLNKQDFRIRFFSNLMVSTRRLRKVLSNIDPTRVERFIIHYKDLKWYSKERHALFLRNVKEVVQRGYIVHLRHNLVDTTTEYDYAIDLAIKHNINYFTSIPLFPGATEESRYTPIEEWKNLMPNIIDIYKKCKKSGIMFDFSKPLPQCFFKKNDFKKYYHKLGSKPCLREEALFRPIVYPDQTVVYCPGAHMKAPKPLLAYENYKDIYFYFKNKVEPLKWAPLFKKCKDCKFFKHKMCQGLCLGFKFYQHLRKRSFGNIKS